MREDPIAYDAWHRELVSWLLPAERPGYAAMRDRLERLQPIGHGRWGEGDIVFGQPGDIPDTVSPHARVFAHGVVESAAGRLSITVHEEAAAQIEIQFSGPPPREALAAEWRRASYSTWMPGSVAPFTSSSPREVNLPGAGGHVIALSAEEQRLWLHNGEDLVNYLLPHTAMYTALQQVLGADRRSRSFEPAALFHRLGTLSDEQLMEAFRICNAQWRLLAMERAAAAPEAGASPLRRIRSLLNLS